MENKEGIKLGVEITDSIIEKIADQIIRKTHHHIDGFTEKVADHVIRKTRSKIKYELVEEVTFTTAEVAEKLNKNVVTIRRHIDSGLLKAHRPGKDFIITETNLNNYIHGINC